jgi:hypothetical protein
MSETLPAINDQTLITRNPALLVAPVHDETVMMEIESGRYYGLDDIGTAVWQRLESPCRFGDLVQSLTMEFDAGRTVIARDVGVLLTRMAEHKVVTLT